MNVFLYPALYGGHVILHVWCIFALLNQTGCQYPADAQCEPRESPGALPQVRNRIDTSNGSSGKRSTALKAGADWPKSFRPADIEGAWIVDNIEWHHDDPIKTLDQIRIDVMKARNDSIFNEAAIYLPLAIKSHELTMRGRKGTSKAWRQLALMDPGWIEARTDGIYFSFGPIGDHLELRASLENGKLRVQSALFDADLIKFDERVK